MFGKLNNKEIEMVLRKQMVGRIGCHGDGLTYVVPIGYAYDDQTIYGHTGEGMKINIMRKNPSVCFQVDHIENISNWQSVILQGEFEEITDNHERHNALQKLLGRDLRMITSEKLELSPDWPYPPDDLDSIDGVVYKIKVREISGRFEKS